MNGACKEALLRLWEMKGKPSNGRVFRGANWTRIFMRLFVWLGFNTPSTPEEQRAVLHSFRHTWCSHLVMAGYNERTVMGLMGWKTSTPFKHYAHLSPGYLQAAVNDVSCGPSLERSNQMSNSCNQSIRDKEAV